MAPSTNSVAGIRKGPNVEMSRSSPGTIPIHPSCAAGYINREDTITRLRCRRSAQQYTNQWALPSGMYRLGHYGVALIVYAPLGLALLLANLTWLAVAGGAVFLALAPLPDIDVRLPLVSHRGITHTVLFAVVIGAVLGAVGWAISGDGGVTTGIQLAAFGFVVGTGAILSHLLGDVITPMGITPFWPLSDRHYTFGLTRADNTAANYLLFGVGILLIVVVLALTNPAGAT